MKGTDKQQSFARDILAAVHAYAVETAVIDPQTVEAGRERVSCTYRVERATGLLAELAVIEALDAGDLEKAQDLFAAVERDALVAGLLVDADTPVIDAGRVIDTYKSLYHEIQG